MVACDDLLLLILCTGTSLARLQLYVGILSVAT
jgi:hypothetical protein